MDAANVYLHPDVGHFTIESGGRRLRMRARGESVSVVPRGGKRDGLRPLLLSVESPADGFVVAEIDGFSVLHSLRPRPA